MRNYFMQVKSFVENKYSDEPWNISGDNYPPSELSVVISNVTNFLWIAGIAFLIVGKQFFQGLGIQEPDIVKKMQENKIMIFVALFMMNNFGASQLATGAFEVYYNDELIYSKLKTNRMPSGDDLIRLLNQFGLESNEQ